MGRNVLGFPFLLTCIHLQLLPIDWTSATVGTWRMQPIAWGRDPRAERPRTRASPSGWFFHFCTHALNFPGPFIVIFDDFLNVFFFLNSILFLFNPWMNYFLTILENSPHTCGLCFVQVFFQFMLFSISRLEAFFRYLVILGSLHMFQSEDYKAEWELWAHRMGWLRMNFPVEWLTWIIWEPPGCRIFIPGLGLWQWKHWVLTTGHPGNSHLDLFWFSTLALNCIFVSALSHPLQELNPQILLQLRRTWEAIWEVRLLL